MRPVVVDIENLTLNGFRYEDRHSVAAALEKELARLLAEPGAAERLAQLGEAHVLRLDEVRYDAGARPGEVGIETARAIGRGLLK